VLVLQAPADPGRFFVVQKNGVVSAVSPDGATAGDFIDITSEVNSSSDEVGLLGMAFHPRWQTNHQAFLFYSAHDGTALDLTSTLSRFTSSDGGKTLDKSSEQVLFTLQKPAPNHNGGMIAFGPDGYLYLGLGDGGGAGDPLGHAQDTKSLFGKILRIDVDHGSPYSIPGDNPFADGVAGRPEVFAWGLRNPWRWSFDRLTDVLWAGDVGQDTWEEVDVIRKGENYGWNIREGAHCYPPGSTCSTAGLTDPIAEYDHTQGYAVTGGYVYRGTALQGLVGSYLYADYGSGYVWTIPSSAAEPGQPRPTPMKLLDSGKSISSFGEDLDGELYVADLNGGIYQIVPPAAASSAGGPATLLSRTGCTAPGDATAPAPGLVPYAPVAPFWSDGLAKERWLSIPDGTQITQRADGDFDFPPGSVLVKSFSQGQKRIETRLFFRYADGGWAGFTYAWNQQGNDATLVTAGTDVDLGGQKWTLPSPAQCLSCHTAAAGFSLGLEAAQLDADFHYPGGRTANQLATLIHAGMVAPGPSVPALPDPQGSAPLEQRARAILHVNCSQCHRPGGPAPSGDFRFATPPAQGYCGKAPVAGDLGVSGAMLVAPGHPEKSLAVLRMQALDEHRMPPLASHVVDQASIHVLTSWIAALASCP
jgi:uncharacterized repeat protein (TIGR03806 family)